MGEGKNNQILNWTNRFLSPKVAKCSQMNREQNQKLLKELG